MDQLFTALSVLDSGLRDGLLLSICAVSVVITLLAIDFPDLSITGVFPFGAAIAASLLANTPLPPALALCVVFCGGAAAGMITGTLHVKLGMSKLLSGICVATCLYSISLLVMGRSNISLGDVPTLLAPFESVDAWFNASFSSARRLFLHPGTIGILAVAAALAIAFASWLLTSEVGVVLRAIGANEKAIRHYRISAAWYKIVGVALASGLAATAGSLSAQSQGFADVNMGVAVLVDALVAVVLGQEIFSRLHLSLDRPKSAVFAAVTGALVYQILIAAVFAAGISPNALRFVSGAMLVLIVALRRRRTEVTFSW